MNTINQYQLMANLLIILLSAMGIMRGIELIFRSAHSLEKASSIYVEIGKVMDLQTFGCSIVILSIVLLVSVFMRGTFSYLVMTIGSMGAGCLHILYGMASSESAKLIATYYTVTCIGLFELIVAVIGGIALWQIFKKKE